MDPSWLFSQFKRAALFWASGNTPHKTLFSVDAEWLPAVSDTVTFNMSMQVTCALQVTRVITGGGTSPFGFLEMPDDLINLRSRRVAPIPTGSIIQIT